jgi:serine/threonine protein kinase
MKTGDTLKDRFVLQTELGSTPFGTVYRALDLRLEEAEVDDPYLAVKVIEPNEDQKAVLKRTTQAAVRIRDIQHKNIMNFYEMDRDEDKYFMTLPLHDGVTLDAYLREHDITSDEIHDIVTGICGALAQAHESGLVHGDFDTAHIFYTADKVAKVFDFGMRGAIADVLGPSQSVYASPAVIAGHPAREVDDVFSLAVVCYELISGKHPFDELTAHQASERGLSPEPISSLSDAAWNMLARGLALDEPDRVNNVSEFAEVLLRGK